MEAIDPVLAYRALQIRDARFDGRLFVGVRSTGVYCRPVCPAGTPLAQNCLFYRSAAAAAEAGFRPCLRCRPETAPELGPWKGTSSTVSRGLALIAEGALDGPDSSVEALADRLGLGARQLRRLFHEHIGASPLSVAQTRRIHFAKQLIHETQLPMTEVAFAAGFGSVRRFNEVFQGLFDRPPSALRRSRAATASAEAGVSVLLRYKGPYDWSAMLGYLATRAMDGVERVEGGRYFRTLHHDGRVGALEVAHRPEKEAIEATIHFPDVSQLGAWVRSLRRLFDLTSDGAAIGQILATDPVLAPMIAARPGQRLPGAWDGFELGTRAILGQQISVEAARRLAGTLIQICGAPIPEPARAHPSLSHCFPTAQRVVDADLTPLRMPGARKRAITALASAALADPTLFQPRATAEQTVAHLRAIPGIGEWTAQYIALRAVREPDAFPASDAGLLRALELDGARPTPAELTARAEAWRPWRAHAAQHLWAHDEARQNPPRPESP